jgi:drug/metabolite transporter (DMT)-like permease
MGPAALAMALFALSSVTARRSVRLLGSDTANLVRIALATALLAGYAHLWGAGFRGPALPWFLLSGVIGYGLCDTAIFLALPRLGAQLTTLMVQCLSVPVALTTERLWLGTRLAPAQLAAIAVILAGVVVALAPDRRRAATQPGVPDPQAASPGPGTLALLLGLVAAVGQALGAVISRHGTQLAREAGEPIDGLSIAYQRITAGLLFTIGWWTVQRLRRGGVQWPADPTAEPGSRLRRAFPWVVINALSGPTLGVACYQWALSREPTGVVLSITALAPLAVIPLAYWLEGERPTRRSLAGGVAAVGGVIWLARQTLR